MTALDWSTIGKRKFESGIDRGVLYVGNSPGVVWSGLISVSDSPSGGDVTPYYLDGVVHLLSAAPTDYQGSLTAYSSPKEFDICEGVRSVGGMLLLNQPKRMFGLTYRTRVGSDTEGLDHGYQVHLIYNVLANTPSRDYQSITDSPDAMSFTWELKAKPVHVAGFKPTAHFIFDSTETPPDRLIALEEILYGTSTTPPHLPSIAELAAILDFLIPPGDDEVTIFDGGSVDTEDWELDLDGGPPVPVDDLVSGGTL